MENTLDIKLDGPRSVRFQREHYKNAIYKKNKRTNEGILINSRQYAIAWGVLNKPYSNKELTKMCKKEDAPSYSFIKKEWKAYPFYYRDLIKHGMEPKPPITENEKRKIINHATGRTLKKVLIQEDYNLAKFCANLGVKNQKHYEELRSKPENKPMMPFYSTVVKRFGTWHKFMYEVMKYNVDITITRYVEESIRAGYWLKIKDCNELKIPIRDAMNILRPRFFNALCYRKKELMDNDSVLPNINGEVKK